VPLPASLSLVPLIPSSKSKNKSSRAK
jgi:hypothetical protein